MSQALLRITINNPNVIDRTISIYTPTSISMSRSGYRFFKVRWSLCWSQYIPIYASICWYGHGRGFKVRSLSVSKRKRYNIRVIRKAVMEDKSTVVNEVCLRCAEPLDGRCEGACTKCKNVQWLEGPGSDELCNKCCNNKFDDLDFDDNLCTYCRHMNDKES